MAINSGTARFECNEIMQGEQMFVIETPEGVFVFDNETSNSPVPTPFGVSSGLKWPYRGTYFSRIGNELGVPAIALFYPDSNGVGALREYHGLGRGKLAGVGPQWSTITRARRPDITDSQPMTVIIEEDVGVSLYDALLGVTIPGFSPIELLSGEAGAKQTAKIQFDIASQLKRLHSFLGDDHGDVKTKNICVRSIGPQPWDLRATLVDLDLVTAQGGDIRKLGATPAYFDAVCGNQKGTPDEHANNDVITRTEYDLGCLAIVSEEIARRTVIDDMSTDERRGIVTTPNPFYWVDGNGGVHIREDDTADILSLLAQKAGLKTLKSYLQSEKLDSVSLHWLKDDDYIDKQWLRKLRGTLMPDYTKYEEAIARKLFENYNAHLIADGNEVKYPDFDSQPVSAIKSNYDQAAGIVAKVALLGYRLVDLHDCEPDAMILSLSEGEVEMLARQEHERWVEERVADGWVYGETFDGRGDFPNKISPSLVPYDELSDDIREYDRQPVREMVQVLAEVGLAIVAR